MHCYIATVLWNLCIENLQMFFHLYRINEAEPKRFFCNRSFCRQDDVVGLVAERRIERRIQSRRRVTIERPTRGRKNRDWNVEFE